jgi:hypothetical protein
MLSGVVTRVARLGIVIVVGAILAIATSGEAAAKHRKGRLHYAHVHHSIGRSHAQPLPQQPVRLGAMRYYGGPKSPMWRGPVESDASEGRGPISAKSVQLVSQQPARLGAMRYYGGPKSPMWRGPVEN